MLQFKDKGVDPFPVQHIRWMQNVLPCIDEVFKYIKIFKEQDERCNKQVNRVETAATLEVILKKETSLDRKFSDLEFETIVQASYNLSFSYNWQLYKQIYRFDDSLFEMLTKNTDSKDVPISVIINNLPYPAFFIDNKFIGDDGTAYRGVYISMQKDYDGNPELGFLLIEDTGALDYRFFYLPLYLGDMTIDKLLEDRSKLKNIQVDQEVMDITVRIASRLINTIIYICSANKEIETVKIASSQKNPRKKKKPAKKNISQNYVGYRLGAAIRKNKVRYVHEEPTKTGTGTKKSPHMRMAHYHSFWTGKRDDPDNRKLIVKFIPPIYVNADSEKNILPVVHPVK